jgi:hypothetical protein
VSPASNTVWQANVSVAGDAVGFPGRQRVGHLADTKEDRSKLSKWGNDLRQTFRTIATAAGVSEIDAKLLMNHSIPGANAGYITRHKLLGDHLRHQQQAISSAVFASVDGLFSRDECLRIWLGPGGGRRKIFGLQQGGCISVLRAAANLKG